MKHHVSSRALLLSFALLAAAVAVPACGLTTEGASTTDPSTSPSPSSTSAPAPEPTTTTIPAPIATNAPGDDGGAPEAGPPNPYAGGAPIAVPAGEWTYVPMNDVVCGNGTTSGIAVNPSPTAGAPLLVFFMGGGACWNALTCLGGTASNVASEVGAAEISADVPRVAALFDRDAQTNPFRDASFVFVPYCTGDIHAGDSERTYTLLTKSVTIKHRGARNADAILKRLLATYPAPPKIWVTGASGGGYGAMLNLHRFKTAWPSVRLDVLDDCGPPVQPTGSTWQDMQSSWNLELPPGCTDCDSDVAKLMPHLASTMRKGRFALLGYTKDKTISAFTGRLVGSDFENHLLALRGAAGPNQRTYFIAGDDHVLLKQNPLPVAPSGVTLATWLTRFATDDPAWGHEGP